MSPEADALHRLEAAVVDAAAHKLAEAILARPMFAEVVVKAIVDEIRATARANVEPMVNRLLVERAGETFAAVDEVVVAIRAETAREARNLVAQNLPSKDDVRRESLAIVRDAVMRSLTPIVERVSDDVSVALSRERADAVESPPVAIPQPDEKVCTKNTTPGACCCDACLPF